MRFPETLPAIAAALALSTAAVAAERPNVLVLTVDTLRADRMSGYGYERPTSPNLDRLMRQGVVFTQSRTVEPLTAPALCAMLTSLFPHESGSTRNGLRMRGGLASLPKLLQDEGYLTAAFVSNWTLRDKITGLAEHFDHYHEIIKHKRWFGLVSGEAHAEQVNQSVFSWLAEHAASGSDRPLMLWVHYVDPHAPYKKHKPFLERLGLKNRGKLPPADRYDTEIAYNDQLIAVLLERLHELGLDDDMLTVFTSDHGESLGEHDYWGHGRNLYEPNLRIPMSVTWPGRITPQVVDAPALNIDLAPTVAGLLGIDSPAAFRGYDWSGVFEGDEPPTDRATQHQAHRGAVLTRHDSELKRRSGLLEVAVVVNGTKEILRVKNDRHRSFDLVEDPAELHDLSPALPGLTDKLRVWMELVDSGLRQSDEAPTQPLDEETIEQLRALGYAD